MAASVLATAEKSGQTWALVLDADGDNQALYIYNSTATSPGYIAKVQTDGTFVGGGTDDEPAFDGIFSGAANFSPASTGQVAFTISGISGQTVDYFDIVDHSGSSLFSMSDSGVLTLANPPLFGSPLAITNGGTGTSSPGLVSGTNITVSNSWPNQTISISGVVAIANGGNGTNSPGLIPGSNIAVSGPWPTQTISLTGTVPAASGGTGNNTYAVGDILYASSASALSRLAAASSGNVLLSGTTPSWGKVALGSNVSGTLPVANGGTGSATQNFVDLTTNQSIGGNKTLTGYVTVSALFSNATAGSGTSTTYLSGWDVNGSWMFQTPSTAASYYFRAGTTYVATISNSGVLAASGFTSGSSFYGPVSSTVAGTLQATTVTTTNPLGVQYGGTGTGSYTVGDILYASGSTNLSRLAAVATGKVLISAGTSTAPAWGQVSLTTAVSGVLPIANGGTGSGTQNFVDLTTAQTVAGVKTFSSAPVSSNGFTAGSSSYGATSATVNGTLAATTITITNPLGLSYGGTGSATKNFVDLTTTQTVAGVKTFSSNPVVPGLSSSGAINTDTGNANGLGLQIYGKNVLYSNGGGSNTSLYVVAPGSGSVYFGYNGASTSYATLNATSLTVTGYVKGSWLSTNGGVDLLGGSGGGASSVYFARDGGPTQGFNFNVPTGSTYGWRFLVNNTGPVAQIDASGNITAASLSAASDVYANAGWLRTYGDAGWYNQTYTGGIYCTDSTWVRTYNNFNFYVSGNELGGAGSALTYGALTIFGDKGGYGGLHFKDASGNNLGTLMVRNNSGGVDYWGIYNAANSGWLIQIDSSGNLTTTGGLYANSLSSLKGEIRDLELNSLDIIKQVDIKSYKYHTDKPGEPRRLGFLAEEAPPELTHDGTKHDVLATISILLDAVKTLTSRVEALEYTR